MEKVKTQSEIIKEGAESMLAFCKSPWVNTKKQLPESNKQVFVAVYTGDPRGLIPGYSISSGCYIAEESTGIPNIYGEIEKRKTGRWIIDGRITPNMSASISFNDYDRMFTGRYGMGNADDGPDFWMSIPPIK